MALKELKRINFKEFESNKLQSNMAEYLNQLPKELLSGRKIENVVVGVATTLISHGLNRAFQGFIIVDLQGDARIWRDSASTADATKFLPLKSSASVTANIWVF